PVLAGSRLVGRWSVIAMSLITGFVLTSCRALGGASAPSPSPESPPPIPAAVLAANGILVALAPAGTQATVSETDAESLALKQFAPGSVILNAALMDVTKDGTPEGACWVVSLNPFGIGGSQAL